jgi:hypothetical protein
LAHVLKTLMVTEVVKGFPVIHEIKTFVAALTEALYILLLKASCVFPDDPL